MTETGKPQRYAIVGTKHIKGADMIIASCPHHQEVTLVREPGNRFDPNAVQVWIDGVRVGYVPKTQNAVLAKFIDTTGQLFSHPTTVASDSAVLETVMTKSVKARVHKGNNTYPLVEIA